MSTSRMIIEILDEYIQKNGLVSFAVSGGSSVRQVFISLGQKEYLDCLDWSKVHVFFIDERCVTENSIENNYKMCFDLWLKNNPFINKHRIISWFNPLQHAREYGARLQELLSTVEGLPSLDLIYMGIGNDGHYASIFSDYEDNDQDLVRHIYVQKLGGWRITFSPAVINSAKNRIIAINGAKKIEIFNQIRIGEAHDLPVYRLLESNAKDRWILFPDCD